MNDFQNHSEAVAQTRWQMRGGWDVLTDWSENASQTRKNAIYTALFSMLDRTLFRTHQIVDDYQRPAEFFVAIKDDLVLKLRANDFESFDVVYIGTWEKAPGFQFGRA